MLYVPFEPRWWGVDDCVALNGPNQSVVRTKAAPTRFHLTLTSTLVEGLVRALTVSKTMYATSAEGYARRRTTGHV